jgi:hypothetical protein
MLAIVRVITARSQWEHSSASPAQPAVARGVAFLAISAVPVPCTLCSGASKARLEVARRKSAARIKVPPEAFARDSARLEHTATDVFSLIGIQRAKALA